MQFISLPKHYDIKCNRPGNPDFVQQAKRIYYTVLLTLTHILRTLFGSYVFYISRHGILDTWMPVNRKDSSALCNEVVIKKVYCRSPNTILSLRDCLNWIVCLNVHNRFIFPQLEVKIVEDFEQDDVMSPLNLVTLFESLQMKNIHLDEKELMGPRI